MGLLHAQDAPAHQVLAQQHTEHGGRVRVLPGQLGHLQPGVVGTGGQQQPPVPPAQPQGQNHLVPARLVDLVDLGTRQNGL